MDRRLVEGLELDCAVVVGPAGPRSAVHLEYKTGDGTVAIDQIKPGGKGTTEVYRATGSKGWSSLVPVGIGQVGSQYMVNYDTDNGTVAIDQISPP